jgi:hypothetical protein
MSITLSRAVAKAYLAGDKRTRFAIVSACLAVVVGIALFALSTIIFAPGPVLWTRITGFTIGGIGILALLGVMVLQNVRDEGEQAQKIAEVERRFEQNPKETGAAWELARVKLESYVNRNLAQVTHIFWLTAFVMLCGFGLIGVGTYKAFADPDHFKSSVLSVSSGVIVSFLGGTFLVLYRSTMAQAKEYVTMLERINAVGMSVQILDTLDDGNKELKHKTIANVATQLLKMYSMGAVSGGASTSKPKTKRAGA